MASSPPPPNWGPTPPAPPGWMPPNAAPAPAPMMTPPASSGPQFVAFWKHDGAMVSLSRWLKVGGLAFFVIGLLVVVAGASLPGSCYTTSNPCNISGSNWYAGALWAMLIGKLLLVLGLAGLALGSLFKLRTDAMPTTGRRDDVDFVLADRRWNGLLFLVAIILLFVVLLTVNPAAQNPVGPLVIP